MVAMAVVHAFTSNVGIKIFGDILREIVTILHLQVGRKQNGGSINYVDNKMIQGRGYQFE